ncbi:cytochrome c oxidase assembly protein [Actinacidiphila paucisporea]|uniref:Putative membrane protein n=1 Tax=Actinacidiphila paucisporea TaxID=310782 RepID=A0A1M7LSJ1_9ACTN|nr:cytochrome c oxidase assembly protein [Actinacidiphila paucisporea]SHM81042.1 putative membrane protein [Actinacidiphila paucisporea]
MAPMPMPAGRFPGFPHVLAALLALAVVAGYLLAARRLRRRGDVWPPVRDGSFAAGGVGLAAVAMTPPPGGGFTGHMVQHLVIGMAAPLLMVLGRPVTLALRALPAGRVRRGLPAAARSRPAGWLLFPPTAAVIDAGGLWLLYRTRLFADTHDSPWLSAAVHVHVLAAGLLFSFAVCGLDPARHRRGMPLRAAAGAAHAVLAKSLYAVPPPGTGLTAHDVARGAEVMYYGGDVIEIALAAVLAWQWYTATGRRLARSLDVHRPAASAQQPGERPA